MELDQGVDMARKWHAGGAGEGDPDRMQETVDDRADRRKVLTSITRVHHCYQNLFKTTQQCRCDSTVDHKHRRCAGGLAAPIHPYVCAGSDNFPHTDLLAAQQR